MSTQATPPLPAADTASTPAHTEKTEKNTKTRTRRAQQQQQPFKIPATRTPATPLFLARKELPASTTATPGTTWAVTSETRTPASTSAATSGSTTSPASAAVQANASTVLRQEAKTQTHSRTLLAKLVEAFCDFREETTDQLTALRKYVTEMHTLAFDDGAVPAPSLHDSAAGFDDNDEDDDLAAEDFDSMGEYDDDFEADGGAGVLYERHDRAETANGKQRASEPSKSVVLPPRSLGAGSNRYIGSAVTRKRGAVAPPEDEPDPKRVRVAPPRRSNLSAARPSYNYSTPPTYYAPRGGNNNSGGGGGGYGGSWGGRRQRGGDGGGGGGGSRNNYSGGYDEGGGDY